MLFDLLEKNGARLVRNSFTDCDCANEVLNRAVDGMKVELENNLIVNCIPKEIISMKIDNYENFLTSRRRMMAYKMREYYFSL